MLNTEVRRSVCSQQLVHILGAKSKPEPDPNETTATCMRILIHTMYDSLFPDADPSSSELLVVEREVLSEGSPPDAGLTALQILLCCQVDADFGITLLPILASILLQDHPLQSRSLLKVFHGLMSRWFSQKMEIVSSKNLNKLLRAIGDPFQHPDPLSSLGDLGVHPITNP